MENEKKDQSLWLVTNPALISKIQEHEVKYKIILNEENVRDFLELYPFMIQGKITRNHCREILNLKHKSELGFEAVSRQFNPKAKTSVNVHAMFENFTEDYIFYADGTGSRANLWRYAKTKGVFLRDGENLIRAELIPLLKENYSSHLVNEVIVKIKAESYNPDVKLGGPSYRICTPNGIYDLETGEFDSNFHPEEYHISGIPVNYDPDADCPNFKKFLGEILGDKDDIMAIEEFFGYCLFKEYKYALILILLGSGANGKSTLLEVLNQFLGSDNVSGCTPQQLEKNRFKVAQLHGKLANIASEIPADPLRYTGQIKMLTGRDLINAEHKNRDSFDFINSAKLIFSANELPPSYDDTTAFHRRVRIIEFPYEWLASDPRTDPNLVEKLTTEQEISGILNLAIKGLERLQSQGHLTGEKSPQEKMLDYVKRSDPVKYFAIKIIEQDSTAAPIPKSRLYDEYVRFCHKIQRVPVNDAWFGKKLKRYVPYLDEGKATFGDSKEVRVWKGIQLLSCEEIEIKKDTDGIDMIDTLFGTSSVEAEGSNVTKGSAENTRLPRLTCLDDDQEKELPDSDSLEDLKKWTSTFAGKNGKSVGGNWWHYNEVSS